MEPPTYREIKMANLKCETCRLIENLMWQSDDSYAGQKLWNQAIKLCSSHHPDTHEDIIPSHHKGNGKPLGIFAGTLTMSPTDATNENEMCAAIQKIFTQQTVPVKRYAWYLEYTKNGLPHIHFIYETNSGGRIHQKIFKRYWKTWSEKPADRQGQGFRGGYHKHVESEIAYTEYIAKDGNIRSKNCWVEDK